MDSSSPDCDPQKPHDVRVSSYYTAVVAVTVRGLINNFTYCIASGVSQSLAKHFQPDCTTASGEAQLAPSARASARPWAWCSRHDRHGPGVAAGLHRQGECTFRTRPVPGACSAPSPAGCTGATRLLCRDAPAGLALGYCIGLGGRQGPALRSLGAGPRPDRGSEEPGGRAAERARQTLCSGGCLPGVLRGSADPVLQVWYTSMWVCYVCVRGGCLPQGLQGRPLLQGQRPRLMEVYTAIRDSPGPVVSHGRLDGSCWTLWISSTTGMTFQTSFEGLGRIWHPLCQILGSPLQRFRFSCWTEPA